MNDPDKAAEVLPNLRDFTDPAELAEYERHAAYLRVDQLEHQPNLVTGDFDFAHLQRIHHFILQDVYGWAGSPRQPGQDTTAFGMAHCRPEFLPGEIDRVFGDITGRRPSPTDRAHAIATVADHWGETTALHAFRDGNSRSQRVFFHRYLQSSGWDIDWRRVNASAVHAARHIAMRTTDSTYLAAALDPGVYKAGDRAPGAMTHALGRADGRESLAIYRGMLDHKSRGRTAATFDVGPPTESTSSARAIEAAAAGPLSPGPGSKPGDRTHAAPPAPRTTRPPRRDMDSRRRGGPRM